MCVEIVSKIVYHYKFDDKEKKYLNIFMGLESDYIPVMVSYYKPHHYLVYVLNPESMEHHQDYFGTESGYYINSHGFRGKEFSLKKPGGTFRIVCIGGSTTFCSWEMEETNTYPQILEDALNKRYRSPRFEVINAGVPGWTTAESLINLHFRILEFDPDMIIVYHGVNDTFAMRRDKEGKSDYSNWRRIVNYKPPGSAITALLRYSAFCRIVYVYTQNISSDITTLSTKKAPAGTDEDRNLDEATGKYFRRNMEAMVTLAKANNIVPVLMTMGHGSWHHSLALNNQITRNIAEKKGAVLVDFEKIAHPSYFIPQDHIHLLRPGNIARVKAIIDVIAKSDLTQNLQ